MQLHPPEDQDELAENIRRLMASLEWADPLSDSQLRRAARKVAVELREELNRSSVADEGVGFS
jgi:hypothetical protein